MASRSSTIVINYYIKMSEYITVLFLNIYNYFPRVEENYK